MNATAGKSLNTGEKGDKKKAYLRVINIACNVIFYS